MNNQFPISKEIANALKRQHNLAQGIALGEMWNEIRNKK